MRATFEPSGFRRHATGACCAVVLAVAGCGGGGGADPAAAVRTTDVMSSTVVVGATSASYPGATRYAQLTDVPWSLLPAGTAVVVAPGRYAGPVTITAAGSATAPITVAAIDAANPPVVTNTIDLQRSSWLQISGLRIEAPTYSGVIVRQASHHVVVADSTIVGAPMGIDITDGAGTAISLLRNRIQDSATNGIGVDGVNADAGERSVIEGNTVVRSGHHGMEIRGSNYRIERNDVSASGQAVGGTSGIHLLAQAEGDGTGSGNVVRYNLSHGNADTAASDGNGIQADRFCDNNTIAFNVAWDNDGAGIAVYDGNANQVYANTLIGNSRDPGQTHGSLGQIVLNSSTVGGARPAGNRVYDNIVVSTRAPVPALYVDTNAVRVSSNVAAPNLLFNSGGGTVLRWTDSDFLTTLADIDTATGNSNNVLAAPAFADTGNPQSDGLRLTASPGPGSVDLGGQIDKLGKTGVAGAAFFGAYFFGP